MSSLQHGGYDLKQRDFPIIVGIINLSPESFYKGSVAEKPAVVESNIKEMKEFGAHIIDVGLVSSRPVQLYGGKLIDEEVEIQRANDILPKLMSIAENYELPISIDTQSSRVAEMAIEMGCTIVNDISGLKNDAKMASVIADNNVELVIMATDKKAGDPCGIDETIKALRDSLQIAYDHGITKDKIAIDPAFGGWQGKNPECDIKLLRSFDKLLSLQHPIYVGVSRKSTINTLGGGLNPDDRLVGSVILTQWLIDHGAHIVRTHDVKETVLGLKLAQRVRNIK